MKLSKTMIEILKREFQPYEPIYYDEVISDPEDWEKRDPDDFCGRVKLLLGGQVVARFLIPAHAGKSEQALRDWIASIKP